LAITKKPLSDIVKTIKIKLEGKMPFPNPAILLHPNLPKMMHGVSPRVLLGNAWWDEHRKKAYAKHDYRCWACGIEKSQASYRRGTLEAHEYYDVNYELGRMYLKDIVALCHSCHNFIHSGRMLMILRAGELSWSKYLDILYYGFMVLKKAGLPPNQFALMSYVDAADYADYKGWGLPAWDRTAKEKYSKAEIAKLSNLEVAWGDWRLVIGLNEYAPKHESFDAWKNFYSTDRNKMIEGEPNFKHPKSSGEVSNQFTGFPGREELLRDLDRHSDLDGRYGQ